MKPIQVFAVRVVMVGVLSGPFLLLGCSAERKMGPTVEVSGKVTLDGKPFSEGSIWFTSPRSGAGFNANLGADGTYALTILDVKIAETYGVHIGGIETAAAEGAVDGAGSPIGVPVPPVPAKYREATTSGLTAAIDKGEKLTLDFELKSDSPAKAE